MFMTHRCATESPCISCLYRQKNCKFLPFTDLASLVCQLASTDIIVLGHEDEINLFKPIIAKLGFFHSIASMFNLHCWTIKQLM